jgi:hypothetical protein
MQATGCNDMLMAFGLCSVMQSVRLHLCAYSRFQHYYTEQKLQILQPDIHPQWCTKAAFFTSDVSNNKVLCILIFEKFITLCWVAMLFRK